MDNDGQCWTMGAGCWRMYVAAASAIVTPGFEVSQELCSDSGLKPIPHATNGKSPHTIGSNGVLLPLSLPERTSPEHS